MIRTVIMKYTARNRAGVIVDATGRRTYTRDCAVEVEASTGHVHRLDVRVHRSMRDASSIWDPAVRSERT